MIQVCYVSLADNLRQDFTLIGQTSSVIQQMVFVSPLICQISKKKIIKIDWTNVSRLNLYLGFCTTKELDRFFRPDRLGRSFVLIIYMCIILIIM